MIVTRQQREALEVQSLAPYAVKSRDSRGRQYPEVEDPHRTVFQRDRDRILHTTAFRRLEYKTQVFINYEGDYYRTRLTHTLEVEQIGRSLARVLGANEDLVEAICLSHDLGHSPFGHSGESILNELMKDYGGYDHNRQTYRIVTELEARYPGWPGLNLTYELLEGLVKHETEYDAGGSTEFDPNLRGSMEAQIANVADELAYNAHDVDDGLRADLLEASQLDELEIWQVLKDQIGSTHFDDTTRHQMIRRMIRLELHDVIQATAERLSAAGVQSPEALQRLPENVVCHTDAFIRMNGQLKKFLWEKLYNHYRVARMAVKARRFIRELFEAYAGEPKQLPPEVQAQIPIRGLQRTVADYIAGMTDRYALQEWQRLYDPFVRT